MVPIYAYPHEIPEVIPFKATVKGITYINGTEPGHYVKWSDVNLYICPKCGSVFGEVEKND